MLEYFCKQSRESLDYTIDFSRFLVGREYINLSSAVISAPVVNDAAATLVITRVGYTKNQVAIWLVGGEDGVQYTVTVTIGTDQGRQKEQQFLVKTAGAGVAVPIVDIADTTATIGYQQNALPMGAGASLSRFTVTMNTASVEPVAVDWSTSDGTAQADIDYPLTTGTIIFAPGETSKTLDVFVYGRTVGNEDRSFFVELMPPANAILGDAQGECVIQVNTSGTLPVTQLIVPTGPRGYDGKSAYQVWLDLGNTGTEQDFIDSLSPSPEDIAQEVAPLLNVGNSPVTAQGTEALSKPDTTTVKELARRIAYVGGAKVATVVLADGDNIIATSDLSGDAVSFGSIGLHPRIVRGSITFSPEWSLEDDGRLLIKGASAGDVLYVCQYDLVSSQPITNLSEAIATDVVEPTNRLALEAVRRTYAELGLDVAEGSFQAGATVENSTQVLLDERDWKAYGWGGVYPPGGYEVAAGSTPETSGGTGVGSWSDKSGYSLRGEMLKIAVPLDAFERLVVGGDWTAALNAALDTGLPVAPNPSRTYSISGIVQSKGNKIVGRLNITPTRAALSSLGTFTFDPNSSVSSFESNIKLLYCLRTYDLIELLYIRSMGFNAIFHGGDMQSERPAVDVVSALNLMLDNASSAQIKVNMTTGHILNEDSMAIGYVTAFRDHPAVWGFSVFDEPTFNGVSVARQTERLAALRQLTFKNLNVTDVIQNYAPFRNGYNPWARGYDTFFVDAYSHTIAGTTEENIAADLRDMRAAVGVAAAHIPEAKIIPMCGLFKHTGFTTSINQIKGSAPVLAKCAGGDFAAFAWDAEEAGLTHNILTGSDLRGLAISLCKMPVSGALIPTAYQVGGSSSNPEAKPPVAAMSGLDLLKKRDWATSFVGSGTALGVLKNGVDGQFTTPLITADQSIAGLFFYGQFPVAVTNIETKRKITIAATLFDVTGSKSGALSVHYSPDMAGSVSPAAITIPFSFSPSNPSVNLNIDITSGEFWRGYKLAFAKSVNPPVVGDVYRSGMHGFIVVSEW